MIRLGGPRPGAEVIRDLFMARPVDAHPLQLVLWIALLAVMVTVAVCVVGKIRAKPAQQELTASELLTKFRELHSRGVLSDAEFRTIRTTLAAQLKQELKGNDETG
jgi:hypothetical protein